MGNENSDRFLKLSRCFSGRRCRTYWLESGVAAAMSSVLDPL
jgi:hypothetical protein